MPASNDMSFPIYLLRLGKEWRIVFPDDQNDIGHTEFWEQTVSHLVAKYFGIPQPKLVNLPYCQRRARIVDDTVYFGGRFRSDLLRAIRKAVANERLSFCFDEHERRLREDVLEFRRLIRRRRRNHLDDPT